MHNQYIVHKISLQHLKEESCEQLLKNAGWLKNHFNKKNGFNKLLTEYSMKYPEMNLEEINIMINPSNKKLFNKRWTNDKRVSDERALNYHSYKMAEGHLNDMESFGCQLTFGEKIERNWDVIKHFVGQISIWDLNDCTKRVVLYQAGWIETPYVNDDLFIFAINNYSLHCPNSNLWNFRVVSNGDVSWDIARCYPYLV